MKLTRRALIQGLGVAGLHAGLGGRAQAAESQRAVVLVFLTGGLGAIFSSADSFLGSGAFSVTASNVTTLGGGLVIDRAFAEALGPVATSHMGTIGVRHGQSGHDGAQAAFWTHASQSAPLTLATAMPRGAPILAAQIGSRAPMGKHGAIDGVSLQRVSDIDAIVRTFQAEGPSEPRRNVAAEAIEAASACKNARHAASANSLASLDNAYGTLTKTLHEPPNPFDLKTVAPAYAVTSSAISDLTTQFAAAEIMLRVGAKVVTIVDEFVWDSHADITGNYQRGLVATRLVKPLRLFLERVLGAAELDPVVVLCSEFARSLPGSDHAGVTSANVFGKRIVPGTTGRVTAEVGLPGAPGYEGFWAFLAEAGGATSAPFGPNPHRSLLGN